MTIETDNACNPFDTKALTEKRTFPRKVKSKSIALSGGLK